MHRRSRPGPSRSASEDWARAIATWLVGAAVLLPLHEPLGSTLGGVVVLTPASEAALFIEQLSLAALHLLPGTLWLCLEPHADRAARLRGGQ